LKFTLFDLHSLKARVTFSTLAIFVFSLWALSFFTSRLLQDDMQRVLGDQQFSTVSFIAAQVNDELRDRMAALELMAKEIDPHLMGDPAALQARLEQRPILSILFNGGIIVTGADGVVIADVPLSSGRIGVNYLERENIAIALKEGKTAIGRPVMGKKLGAPVFSIAAPIADAQGTVIGALVGTINLGKPNFLDKITQSGYGQSGGYALIAPQYRLVVTATDQSRIMATLPAAGINEWVDRFIQGYEGSSVAINPRGVEVLVSGKRIPVAGWHILAALPTAEAFAPIVAMQQRFLFSVSFFTVLASALTWWLLTWTMRRQFAPIVATVNTLDTLAESNQPPQPLPITRQDEIGELIGSFNRLLEILGKRNEELRESRILLEQTFEQSPVPMVLVSMPDAVLQIVNPALREQLGILDEPSPVNTLLADFRPSYKDFDSKGNEVPIAEAPIVKALSGQRTIGVERMVVRKDGTIRWQSLIATPICNAKQEIIAGYLILIDTTAHKQAEAELLRSNAELEQFAYVISHDLRQPLRMVNGYVQMLERRLADTLDDDARGMMHFAVDGAKRMDQMLVSLLEYSRVGRKGEPMAPLASRSGVDEALRFLAPVIREANATVRVSGDWPEVVASRDEFTRLWQNLIGNAVKYCAPDCAPDIAITVTPDADGWRFCVADNGIGIAPTQFDRLFKVFQRLVTRDQYEGTGIGLAVARKIVERHGGRIWVESAGAGQGCRFCFSLPVRRLNTEGSS
jgi:signal transduction histidine kinase/HAMP domain-containing protein